jgi:formate-dependent phosphoribosylglycinamide formyltransferase (GAR transformylase)
MNLRKRLMILGAGPWQLPLIQKAVARGLWAITVDNVPGNVGHTASQQFVECSTTDAAGVLDWARRLRIDGIVTMASDVAVPTLGHVADALGLPGCPAAVARTLTNKTIFRRFQAERGDLQVPAFVVGHQFDDVFARLSTAFTPPVLFKPADSSGSRGLTRVEALDHKSCRAAFERALRFSRCGLVCAESFVEGIDVSGDGMLRSGGWQGVFTRKRSNAYVPYGHELPTDLDAGGVKPPSCWS